jgi:crotonobetainyl-CoA:carnitine CoA-transferase CaiB-like acyl-CoA transferase
MVTMLDFQAARWLIGKEIPPQAGNDHPTNIPTGVFRTADGHINIAASGQTMFRRLCQALGIPALVDDPRFKTPPDRSKNRAALTEELEKVLGWRRSTRPACRAARSSTSRRCSRILRCATWGWRPGCSIPDSASSRSRTSR